MALTATYDPVLSRVRLAADALGVTATHCYVWRTLNNFLSYETVRGGDGSPVSGGVFNLDDYEFPVEESVTYQIQAFDAAFASTAVYFATIEVVLDRVWLKVVARPFLNRTVTVGEFSEISRAARQGVFPIVGRSFPVAVSDLRGSRQWTLSLYTETPAERRDIDLMLSTGEPVFLHVPTDCPFPGGHYAIGDTVEARTGRRSERRRFDLALTEIATPGPHVVGAASTWQTVLDLYPTWGDLIADKATWADVLELIGSPSEVIVP